MKERMMRMGVEFIEGILSRIGTRKETELSRQPKKVVQNYEKEMSQGLYIEGEKSSSQSFSAQVNHAELLWYLTGDTIQYPGNDQMIASLISETTSEWNEEKFARHASSILHRRRENWVLYGVRFLPTSLIFYYENRKSENKGSITLDLAGLQAPPFAMCLHYDGGHSYDYEINYDPGKDDGLFVHGKNKRTGEIYEYNFHKDSIMVDICYRRPQGLPDR